MATIWPAKCSPEFYIYIDFRQYIAMTTSSDGKNTFESNLGKLFQTLSTSYFSHYRLLCMMFIVFNPQRRREEPSGLPNIYNIYIALFVEWLQPLPISAIENEGLLIKMQWRSPNVSLTSTHKPEVRSFFKIVLASTPGIQITTRIVLTCCLLWIQGSPPIRAISSTQRT